MAVREIKTTLAVDGAKAFDKEIREAGRNMRIMASDMKAAAAEFNLTGDEMDFLTKKNKSLNDQIKQQEAIIKALENAIKESAKAYGDASEKTDGYRIKLNNAQASLAKLKKELEDSNREITELGRDAGRVGRQLEQGLGEAAEDTARKFDKMVNQLDQDLIDIKGAVEFSALADVGDMLSGGVDVVVNAVSGLTEGTLDYRRQMAILEQNAKDMGFDPDWLKQQAAGIAALTGDMDGAVEAVSNLARVAPDMDDFTLVMNRLLGATIAWPDTFKIENLAESLQESLSSGSITGAYRELMSRLGLDIETINKSFEEAAKEGQDALWTAGTAWTSEHGFEETIAEFREMYKELIAYNESKIKLTESEAGLATLLTPAATKGIEMVASMIDSITGMITAIQDQNEKTRKETEEQAKIIDEQTGNYTKLEELNRAQAQADAAGDTQKAAEIETQKAEVIHDIAADLKEADTTAQQATEKAEQTAEKILEATNSALESFGRSLIGDYWFDKLFGEDDELMSSVNTIGKNIATSVGNGVDENASYAVSAVSRMMARMQSELNRGLTMPSIRGNTTLPTVSRTAYAGTQTTNVTLTLNEKTLGKASVPTMSENLGVAVDRYEMYG